ncbi:MAG: hypothetical protein WC533_02035 [Candidatus Pacearchaeota archaeon]
MSTEFYVHIDELADWNRKSIPRGLIKMKDGNNLLIGICRGNQDRHIVLSDLLHEQLGEWELGRFSKNCPATIKELRSSDKPFYAKWSKESPIEFFDKSLRFCWSVNLAGKNREINCPDEYHQRLLELWGSFLDNETSVYHGSSYPIYNWENLKEAVFGEERIMEPSMFAQGSTRIMRTD